MENKGAVNLHTIEELENFFKEKNISSEKTRFFINQNRSDPKCFGIYKDEETNEYVVYKNKSDGTRFVRYKGDNEDIAVNVFFSKLKDEMKLREKKKDDNSKKKDKKVLIGTIVGIVAVVSLLSVIFFNSPKKGYYIINDDPYYYDMENWYYYDDGLLDWYEYQGTPSNYKECYQGDTYDSSYDFKDIETSSNYEYKDSDFDDYDFDSWDSSDTDWDSDW